MTSGDIAACHHFVTTLHSGASLVDMQAAEEDLRRFIGLLEASSQMDIESWSRNVQVDSRKSRQVRAEINEWRPVIEAYAREIGPDYLEALRVGLDSANGAGIPAAQRLLGAMTKQERIDAVIGQQGPKLAAVGMHQWVWVPAAPAWDVGHRRDAVQRACTSVFDRRSVDTTCSRSTSWATSSIRTLLARVTSG